MEFKVVDVPEAVDNSEVGDICTALAQNIGKGIEIECRVPGVSNRVPNTLRKSIRAALNVRGLLLEHDYKTRVNGTKLTVWLAKRDASASPSAE